MSSFIELLAGIDVLGVGSLVGSLLFLGGLIYVLVDNRGFEEFRKPRQESSERDETPKRPPHTGRAA